MSPDSSQLTHICLCSERAFKIGRFSLVQDGHQIEMLIPTPKEVFPFLKLPRELRNSIYAYALEWPDYSRKFGDVQSWSSYEVRCRNVTPVFEAMVTPTVLLLNHQITSEALPILYEKSFILTSPPPSQENYPQNFINPVLLTEFISKSTIRRMRFVILHLDLGFCSKAMSRCANGWKSPIDALLGLWTEENRLESVRFEGGYEPPSKEFGWTFDHCMHHAVVTDLLRKIQGHFSLTTPFENKQQVSVAFGKGFKFDKHNMSGG